MKAEMGKGTMLLILLVFMVPLPMLTVSSSKLIASGRFASIQSLMRCSVSSSSSANTFADMNRAAATSVVDNSDRVFMRDSRRSGGARECARPCVEFSREAVR